MLTTRRTRILFLSANPTDTNPLRIDQEHRTIAERLRAAEYRDRFDLLPTWAVRSQDLQGYLLRHRPDIVHFSGHGYGTGSIAVENPTGEAHTLSVEAIVRLFGVFRGTVRCIVLNACHSDVQATALAEEIDCVIGMSTSIGDDAAIAFSGAFYQALAYGECVDSAYKLGCNQIQLDGLGEELTPTFHLKSGVAPFGFVAESAASSVTVDTDRVDASRVMPQAEAIAAALIDQSARGALQSTGQYQLLSFVPQLFPSTIIPSPVAKVAHRPETVLRVRQGYDDHRHVAIYGSSGSGKSQLAILTAQSFTGRRVWIPLRRQTDGAEAIITCSLRALFAQSSAVTRRDFYREICSSLGPDSIIVLDDLPRSGGSELFDEALADLCAACSEYAVSLLTTSARPLPWRTRETLGSLLQEMPAPPFLDEEVQNLFRSYGAPEEFLRSRWLRLSTGVARQHPVLLVEAARYLHSLDWSTTDDVLDGLLLGRFARTLDMRTTEDIQRTVPDPATRDLLYRVRLIGSPFVLEQVGEVSAVSPSISSPFERLADLLGLWIQQDSASEYIVCPLVACLDENNLSIELRQKVHHAIALGIMARVLRKHTFGPEEALQAIVHFTSAAQFDEAAKVLVLALHGIMQQGSAADHFLVSSIWVDMPLPDAIDHETKIYIRAMQIVVQHRQERDVSELLDDLDRLLAVPGSPESRVARAGMSTLVATEFVPEQPDTALRYLRHGFRTAEALDISCSRGGEAAWLDGLLNIFWIVGFNSTTTRAFEAWFLALQELRPKLLAGLQSVELADRCCEFICAGIWMREADRAVNDHRWEVTLESLRRVEDWATIVGFPVLEACSIRGQIVVHAEYKKDLGAAIGIGADYLNRTSLNPKSRFLIRDIVARQYSYQRHTDKALEWFDRALEDAEAMGLQWRVETLAVAGATASRDRRERALDYFCEALRLVGAETDTEGIPHLLPIKVSGEKVVALWRLDRRQEAYRTWSVAAQDLLSERTDKEDWIILYRLFGAYTAYFAQVLQGLSDPLAGTLEPEPGLLLRGPKGLLQGYQPDQEWMLAGAMAITADASKQFDDAVSWSARCLDMAPAGAELGQKISFGLYSLPRYLNSSNYEEILLEALRDDALSSQYAVEIGTEAAKTAAALARRAAVAKIAVIVMEVGRIHRQDSEGARALTTNLSSRIETFAPPKDYFWGQVASVFSEMLSSGSSWKVLFESAKAASDNHLQMIAGFAAIHGAPLPQAARLQVTLLRRLQCYVPATVFELVVFPCLRQFWQTALDESGFQFSAPRVVRSLLADSALVSVQSILSSVCSSLGVPLDAEDRSWLES